MINQEDPKISILNEWALNCLDSQDCILQKTPEIVQRTAWSNVIRYVTNKGNFYLKQTPPAIFIEPKVMQFMANQLNANVPTVVANNDELHCFIMSDGGLTLRQYLKTHNDSSLLIRAIREFSAIQRSSENHISSFLALSVPDWRLKKFPGLYHQLIEQTEVLREVGMTKEEIKLLHALKNKILEECEVLSEYRIPETLVQPDFNTNNILLNPKFNSMTLIDLGEIAITHPFFSMHNFLLQSIIHHNVKKEDQFYLQMQEVYIEDWLEFENKKVLNEVFILSKKLWPLYSALAYYRLIDSIRKNSLKDFFLHTPIKLANQLRKYLRLVS